MAEAMRLQSVADRWERVLFLLFFGYFFIDFGWSLWREPMLVTALYLLDQTIIIAFLLFPRKAAPISMKPADHAVAVAGTLLPLLVTPGAAAPLVNPAFCAVLMLAGIAIHLGAKLSLRRSFGILPADRGIKAGGLYRLVRHPMYLGYFLVQLGLLLSGPGLWNIAVIALCWVCILLRIAAEERVLALNAEYRAFQERTRYRLLPGLY